MVGFSGYICETDEVNIFFLDLKNKRLIFYIGKETGSIVIADLKDYQILKSYDTSKCEPIDEKRAKKYKIKLVRIYNAVFEPYYLYNIYMLSSRKNRVYILEYYNAFTAENQYEVFKRFTDALAEIYD